MRNVKWIFFDVGSTLVDETAACGRWARDVLAGTDIPPAEFETRRRHPAEAAMVGDRLDNDIAPARQPGLRTVRILRGYGALSRPRDG